MDFASLTRAHTSECLVAITESCFQLQTLTIWGLDSDLETRSSIEQFFQQHRPDLRHFKLKWCMGLDYALELMPTVTVAALERVCFESSIRSHPALHRFMTRCSSLHHEDDAF
ncbi:hypothetical protein BGZ54_001579 [Gamsiella multidivaricata]|nr:hypothetical protein BGZ54_001579 [Gamsiella multidivaricata]